MAKPKGLTPIDPQPVDAPGHGGASNGPVSGIFGFGHLNCCPHKATWLCANCPLVANDGDFLLVHLSPRPAAHMGSVSDWGSDRYRRRNAFGDIRGIVVTQRRFFLTNPFPMTWAAFAIISLGAMGLNWVLYAMLQSQAVDPQILLWQYVLLMGLFPLVTVLLAYTQMVLLKDV